MSIAYNDFTSSFALDQQVREDFYHARRRAFLHRLARWITRKQGELLSFDIIRKSLRLSNQHDLGIQEVPLIHITGSIGRYHQFDRDFMPRDEWTRERWLSIDRAHHQGIILPPVKLYKICNVYFVEDGNHRVSVAKAHGQDLIEAHVIEFEGYGEVTQQVACNFGDS